MEIVEVLLTVFLIAAYAVINLRTAKVMSARDMRHAFIEGQCVVGMICANIFYAPAWFLKGVRFVALATIK